MTEEGASSKRDGNVHLESDQHDEGEKSGCGITTNIAQVLGSSMKAMQQNLAQQYGSLAEQVSTNMRLAEQMNSFMEQAVVHMITLSE